MFYYQHNLGDWATETQGLSLAHVGAYIRLIDRYASTEKPIKTQWVFLAFSKDDVRIANEILESFFEYVETPTEGWIHPRIKEEIAAFQAKAERNRANGKRGGRPRKILETQTKPTGFSNETETEPKKSLTVNRKPITNIEEEKKEKKEAEKPTAPSKPSSRSGKYEPEEVVNGQVSRQAFDDWMTVRKAKHSPLTPTAWARIKKAAQEAGISANEAVSICATRGWVGFEASWIRKDIQPRNGSSPANYMSRNFDEIDYHEGVNEDGSF